MKSFQCNRRGSALILALWALLLLSAAVFAWVKLVDQDLAGAGEANAGLEARAWAHSGVQIALHPKVTAQTPLLEHEVSPDHGYKVKMTGEAGKLNLNWLLTGAITEPPAGDAEERLDILKRYFARRGLSFDERQKLVDCMLDWIDADNVHRLNGAEEDADYHPPNRGSLISVDEVAQIKSSQPLVSQPGWQDDFTIFTNPGNIDLQSVSRAVLEVLPNVGDARAERFIQIRQGPDRLDNTEDDRVFKDLKEALSYLGMTGDAGKALAPYVTLKDQTMHIRSEGQSGKVYRQLEVVVRKVGAQPQIIWWKE